MPLCTFLFNLLESSKKHATYVTKWSLKFNHHDRLQRTDRQEYICVLSLTLRTPGWPTRREYSSTPLTLFAWLRVRVRPSVVPCVHGMCNWTSDNLKIQEAKWCVQMLEVSMIIFVLNLYSVNLIAVTRYANNHLAVWVKPLGIFNPLAIYTNVCVCAA